MGLKTSKLTESYFKAEPIRSISTLPHLPTLPDRLRYFADLTPEKDAVVFASTDGPRQAVTFKELYANSKEAAERYIHLGVRRGEYVAINVRPCPEWLYITFGAMMAGLRPVNVSFTYKDGSDLVALMEKLQTCSCLIMDPGFEGENWSILSPLLDNYLPDGSTKSKLMPYLRLFIVHDVKNEIKNTLSWADFFSIRGNDVTLPKLSKEDTAILFQTSGSTGLPKLVTHTHQSFDTFLKFPESPAFSAEDRFFCDRPFAWAGGFPLSPLFGQTRVAVSGFCSPPKDKAAFLLKVVREENCQIVLGLSAVIHEMFDHIKDAQTSETMQLKTIIIGGQPITRQTTECLDGLSKYIVIIYGGTEFGVPNVMVTSNITDLEDFSCGYLLPGNEMKILNDDGNIVPLNTRGEIYMRTNCNFNGYLNDPEKTKAVLNEDGWYKTDDIGIMREDGMLKILGRKSHMIISGGMNVDPAILETLIGKCPGVDSVVVVPIPDKILYQVVCACVKVVPRISRDNFDACATGNEVDETRLRKFCEEAHGDKHGLFTVLPKYYLFVDTFPETPTGKISRIALSKMAVEKFNLK